MAPQSEIDALQYELLATGCSTALQDCDVKCKGAPALKQLALDNAHSCPASLGDDEAAGHGSRQTRKASTLRSDTADELDPAVDAQRSSREEVAELRTLHFRNTAGGVARWQAVQSRCSGRADVPHAEALARSISVPGLPVSAAPGGENGADPPEGGRRMPMDTLDAHAHYTPRPAGGQHQHPAQAHGQHLQQQSAHQELGCSFSYEVSVTGYLLVDGNPSTRW